MAGEENQSKLVWDASRGVKIWRWIGVQEISMHDTTGLWWDFGTYSRWHNQKDTNMCDLIPAYMKLAAAIWILAIGDNYTNLTIQVSSTCKYFTKVYPRSIRCNI